MSKLEPNLVMAITIIGGAFVPALAIGWIGSSGLKGIARNPEAGNEIRTSMILSIALRKQLQFMPSLWH